MKKVLVILFTLIAMVVSPPALARDTSKDIPIKLVEGVSEFLNGTLYDVIQTGIPISKHLVVILTTAYQADGYDPRSNRLCFYYVDIFKGIKVYVSSVAQDPIDVLAKGNEAYLDYLIDVGEAIFSDGGIGNLVRACKTGVAPQELEERDLFNIN